MNLQIKSMVCPRCISSIRNVLNELGIAYNKIELGSVELPEKLSDAQSAQLAHKLKQQGFELLSSEQAQIINAIKSFVIKKVHYSEEHSNIKLSAELSALLHKDYSTISKSFSRSEGITIEHYLLNQRIERVKELLSYEQKTISEIAIELGFSSTAHLSSQFKKITGMPPSAFKKLSKKPRNMLDKL